MSLCVAALYQFAALPDFEALREPLLELCTSLEIRGTLLLASEGINGTVAGTDEAIDALVTALRGGPLFGGRLGSMELKFSRAAEMPFRRLKVKLKAEIVALGLPEIDPTRIVGTYVEPADWNALIADPDVLVVDTRNHFEFEMGSFDRALDPETRSFADFPEFVRRKLDPVRDRRIAMFCTGGIRCEKASAYLKAEGFDEVYHLKGGILRYLETVPAESSRWHGDCFVFDERIALGHGLEERRPPAKDQTASGASGSSRR
ncbi:hypothetical protein C3941_07745 [Kaistia algarum]|uniref:oxygen-dependent tRNA uridine(34) hydroxylase TrhO n=1 Tax=Kaistia algarum TaxID=2083279 RepID=UPI000CE74A58|nr:rhodanese-related sulfurtransferase [Kaistia algarum]MCX5511948.1 rhodanese-related sulfurtransferase [Kaistia algarum]PPE80080.1 hypothetical protein C3941_07745 [Kaistia algarum]